MAARKTAAAPAAPAPVAPAAPTKSTELSFEFSDAAVPEKTRVSTVVNPLRDVCETLKNDWNKDENRSRLAKSVKAHDANQVAKIKRWLALAGNDLGVTFRSVVADDNTVTFWAVPRILKTRKNGNGNSGTASQ